MRLRDVSPLGVAALVAAWLLVVAASAAAYVTIVLATARPSAPDGSVFMVQFTPGGAPIREAWPGYLIVFGPPVALVFAWTRARRRRAGAIGESSTRRARS